MRNLKHIFLVIFSCVSVNYIFCQYHLTTTDTVVSYRFKKDGQKMTRRFDLDTIRLGTSVYHQSFIIYGESDSVVVSHDPAKKLEDQFTYITVQSATKKMVVRTAFWAMNHEFTDAYVQQQMGKSTFEIPEVYELANIVLALALDTVKSGSYILSNTKYHKEVMQYFATAKQHPAILALWFQDKKNIADKYFSFRENSYCFALNNEGEIVRNYQYNKVFYNQYSSLFEELIPLLNDFVEQTKFRSFFKSHIAYYDALLKETEKYMPIKQMWTWVEKEFPQRSQSYKTIISPLIDGNHSTQNYTWLGDPNKPFRESLMFVCGSGRYEGKAEYTDKQIEGFLSGVVFTEIDHNYVNPTTDKYVDRVNKIFAKRELWAIAGKPGDLYKNQYAVFNEYMTHALFFVYLLDIGFTGADYDLVRSRRIAMNEDRRGFRLFTKFTDHLIELYKARPKGKTIADLYPEMLDWCEKQTTTD